MKLDKLIEALGSWRDPLHCHIFGKAGETFMATGFLSAIRTCARQAEIVYHVHEQYLPMIVGARDQPDEIETYPRRPGMSLMEDVNERIYAFQADLDGVGWVRRRDGLHLSMFYENLTRPTDEPFYRQNMHSLGVGHLPFSPPRLANPVDAGTPIALALPTGNWQSVIQKLPVPPSEWERLASLCVKRGWKPMARGYTEDGLLDMSGWDVKMDTQQIDTLRLGPSVVRVIGLNTGMTFAVGMVSPGHMTMLNPHHGQKYYDIESMVADGVIDLKRHHQVPVPHELSPQEATRLVEQALFGVA